MTIIPARPVAVYAYFDRVAVWLRQPISKAALAELERHCGKVHAGKYPARFDPNYQQRLDLKQPKIEALIWLAKRDDAYINQVEIALDLIFHSPRETETAFEFSDYHLVRNWHGKNQKINIHKKTRYDANSRRAANSMVVYPEKHSRITGETDCLHLEWRANSRKAVIAAGIETGKDLRKFDHYGFWKKRLLFYIVKPGRIGRYLRNRATKGSSRTSTLVDRKKGNIVLKSVNNIQELVDNFQIRRVLTPISNETWLPDRVSREVEGISGGCKRVVDWWPYTIRL